MCKVLKMAFETFVDGVTELQCVIFILLKQFNTLWYNVRSIIYIKQMRKIIKMHYCNVIVSFK